MNNPQRKLELNKEIISEIGQDLNSTEARNNTLKETWGICQTGDNF